MSNPSQGATPAPAQDAVPVVVFPANRNNRVEDQRESVRRSRIEARIADINWRPTTSVSVLRRQVQLGMEDAQYGISLWFPRVQSACYALSDRIAMFGDVEYAESVIALVETKIRELHEELLADVMKLESAMIQAGYDATPEFTGPYTFNVPIFTPAAGDFLQVIADFDRLMWMAHVMRSGRLLSLRDHRDLRIKWRRRIFAATDTITRVQVSARIMFQQYRADRRAALDARRASRGRRNRNAAAGSEKVERMRAEAEAANAAATNKALGDYANFDVNDPAAQVGVSPSAPAAALVADAGEAVAAAPSAQPQAAVSHDDADDASEDAAADADARAAALAELSKLAGNDDASLDAAVAAFDVELAAADIEQQDAT